MEQKRASEKVVNNETETEIKEYVYDQSEIAEEIVSEYKLMHEDTDEFFNAVKEFDYNLHIEHAREYLIPALSDGLIAAGNMLKQKDTQVKVVEAIKGLTDMALPWVDFMHKFQTSCITVAEELALDGNKIYGDNLEENRSIIKNIKKISTGLKIWNPASMYRLLRAKDNFNKWADLYDPTPEENSEEDMSKSEA